MSDRLIKILAAWGSLVLLAVWAVLLKGHSLALMDTLEYAFPEKWVNVQSFRAGQIPLWNPWNACGLPHVGNLQSAAFYPPFWLWNLTGLFDWFFWMGLAHAFLAGAGFYFWMRREKVKEGLASLTALGFASSALMVQYWGFPTHLATAAWVPWIFWATRRFQSSPTFLNGVWLTVFWSLDFLAGYVYFTFYAALLWAAWLGWVVKPSGRQILALGAVALGALGLTACQWMPFLDFLENSYRPGLAEGTYSLHPQNFLSLLSPTLLGVPGTSGYRGDYPDFIFNNFYLGLAPLGLWLAGWGVKAGKGHGFWKWSGPVALIWTAGVHSPLGFLLPAKFFGILDPAKAGFLFLFCAFAFIGLWLQPRLDGLPRHKPFPRWVSLLAVAWLLEAWLSPWRVLSVIQDPYRDAGMIKAAALVGQSVGEGRMVSLHRDDLPASDPSAGPGRSILDRFLGLPPNSNAVWGIRSAGGYFSVFPDGYQNLLAYLNRGYPYDGRVLDAAGVDLILLQDKLSPFKYRALADWGPYVLNHNAGAMAPLWLDGQVREFPDRASVFGELTRSDAFLENEMDTEKSPDGKALRLPPPDRGLGTSGPGLLDRLTGFWQRWSSGSQVEAQALSPCRISARVNSRNPGFVVLSQTFSPGWRAWVDGKPEALFRADGLFMGLVVDQAGLHQVDFRYEPAAFRLGLFCSLVFVTFLGLGLTGRFLIRP